MGDESASDRAAWCCEEPVVDSSRRDLIPQEKREEAKRKCLLS